MAIRTGTLLHPATTAEVERALTGGGRDTKGSVFRALLLVALLTTLVLIGIIIVDNVTRGWDVLSTRLFDFITGKLRAEPDDPLIGVGQGLVGSFWIAMSVLVLAIPTGVAAAIYLEEYAPKNRLTRFIDLNIRNLAGVPSVVYGILGFSIFVKALGELTGPEPTNGRSLLSACLTLSVLVLPIVIITSAEAIRAVPYALREGAFGVGATRWEAIRTQVLPYAAPGILTGTLLSMARAVGEAAPLILVGGVTGRLAAEPQLLNLSELIEDGAPFLDRFTAMPIIISGWSTQKPADFQPNIAAAVVVLLVFVLLLNSAAIILRNRYEKKRA